MAATDPVCGMSVDEKKPAAISEVDGRRYYFCSTRCKKAFDAEPDKYIG